MGRKVLLIMYFCFACIGAIGVAASLYFAIPEFKKIIAVSGLATIESYFAVVCLGVLAWVCLKIIKTAVVLFVAVLGVRK